MNTDGKAADERRLRDVFVEALGILDSSKRAAFVKSACRGDDEMRRQVEELLAGQDHIGDFLEKPAMPESSLRGLGGIGSRASREGAGIERVGERIGRYKLLQEIGEGGCGMVYMAEQEEPVRRRVALKVTKAGMDTRAVIARFEAERQALALMDHPNIARVLDAGATPSGRPYFVMELVRGVRITEYCDQSNLSVRERLELFIKVCHAIEHAHQKGVIHRDIKPSNVLVTLHDGEPAPKVIDFGIAKAIEQRLTEKTVFTAFEQFVGTPAYMSPEQAEMSGADIDTRSDIYSLGVLLYEMLTGKTPFDGRELVDSGLDAMRRTIREKEPVPPSTRLQTLAMTDAAELTRHRGERIPSLVKMIRGDLDWIVMKAVAKDRARRYQTASALAADIQRSLTGQPILARPPSRIYQAQKFVQRNRLLVAAGACVFLILAAAAVVSSGLAFVAIRADRESAFLLRVAETARLNEARHRHRSEKERLAALRGAYNSDMNLVPQALFANNYGRAVDLLNRHRRRESSDSPNLRRDSDPDFRQWEWRYFWTQAQSEAAFALPRQSNAIVALALSADGKYLAASDGLVSLKVWDLFRRGEILSLPFGRFARRPFAFSPQGDHLAVVDAEENRTAVKIWSVGAREAIHETLVGTGIQALAFSPDGLRLILLGEDQAIRSWDILKDEMRIQGSRRPRFGRVFNSVFSRDARLAALIGEDGIQVLNAETGAEQCRIAGFELGSASAAFSPDGALLAVSPRFTEIETDIKLYSTATGEEAGRLAGNTSWVPGVAFNADGSRLISAGADQTVRVWDVAGRRELAALRGHLSEINCAAISSDGKIIVSGCKDGTIFGWEAERSRPAFQTPFHTLPGAVKSVEFFPDSQTLLSVNADETVAWWDAKTLHQLERVAELSSNGVQRILIAPNGSRLYASMSGGQLMAMDWPSRAVVTNLFAPGRWRSGIFPVGIREKRGELVAIHPELGVCLWNTKTWEAKTLPGQKNEAPFFGAMAAVSPNERLLAASYLRRGVEILDLDTGKVEESFSFDIWGPSGMAFSPDSHVLALSSREGTVHLWDLRGGEGVNVIRAHLIGVHAVAYSPDGARLASASAKNEAVKLWDTTSGHEVATLGGDGSLFNQVKFSPDGTLLVAINQQGKAHIWRAPPLSEIDAMEVAGR